MAGRVGDDAPRLPESEKEAKDEGDWRGVGVGGVDGVG